MVDKFINQEKLKRRGSIIVLSLWTLLFLSILALFSGFITHQEILLAKKVEIRNKSYELVYAGALILLDVVTNLFKKQVTGVKVDSWGDFWANNPNLFKEIKLEEGVVSVYHNHWDNFKRQRVRWYGLDDEESKININYVSKDVLQRLFSLVVGKDKECSKLVGAIIDWRDKDDFLSNSKSKLSERVDYINSGYTYTPKNAPFKSIEELLLVKGMTEEIFMKIKDYITVFGSGRVNINTASREVLLSVGLMNSLVEKIIRFRCGGDMIEGNENDNVFSSLSTVISQLLLYYDISNYEKNRLQKAIDSGILGVSSTTFSAICVGKLEKGQGGAKVRCIFDKNGKVKYWSCKYISPQNN